MIREGVMLCGRSVGNRHLEIIDLALIGCHQADEACGGKGAREGSRNLSHVIVLFENQLTCFRIEVEHFKLKSGRRAILS